MRAERAAGRWGIRVAALGLGLVLAGAGTGEAGRRRERKPTAPHPAVVKAKESLRGLIQAYTDSDTEGVMQLVAQEFYPDISRFRQSLYHDRRDHTDIKLDIIIDNQFVGRETTSLGLTWNRTLVVNATGVPRVDRGQCRFVFKNDDGKLIDLQGARPLAFSPP